MLPFQKIDASAISCWVTCVFHIFFTNFVLIFHKHFFHWQNVMIHLRKIIMCILLLTFWNVQLRNWIQIIWIPGSQVYGIQNVIYRQLIVEKCWASPFLLINWFSYNNSLLYHSSKHTFFGPFSQVK